MSNVFVLDTSKKPLDLVHPGYARKLLSSGQAAVFRRYPFTLILKQEIEHPVTHPLRLKIDPGSKTTGKYAGTHEGRFAIRFRPSFRLNGLDVHPKYVTRVHRSDGYSYTKGGPHSSLSLKA